MTDVMKRRAAIVARNVEARGCDCPHVTWCRSTGLDREALRQEVEWAMADAVVTVTAERDAARARVAELEQVVAAQALKVLELQSDIDRLADPEIRAAIARELVAEVMR
jgi:hypothetical protein